MRVRLLLLLFALAFAVPTFAGTIDIDFEEGLASGGTFTTSGGNAVGTKVPITVLKVDNGTTVLLYPVTGGLLNFNTAADSIQIMGAIPSLSIPMGILSTGDFASWTITAASNAKGSTCLGTGGYCFDATGEASTSSALLGAIGLPTGQGADAYDGFAITASNPVKGTSGYHVTSADIKTTALTPEPVSMMLMGTFLSLAGGLLSRKKRA